jgi:hypothetical protein
MSTSAVEAAAAGAMAVLPAAAVASAIFDEFSSDFSTVVRRTP